MTRKDNTAKFDNAVSDVFQNGPACGAFGDIDALSKRREVNDILSLASQPSLLRTTEPSGPRRRIILLASAAAVLVSVLVGALVYTLLPSSAPSNHKSPSTDTWFGEVLNPGDGLFLGETLAMANAPVPVEKLIRVEEGDAILRLPTGIDWRLTAQAGGKILPVTSDRLFVTLQSGESWFRVNPERRGPAFSVKTPFGQIHVTGTVFVVNVAPEDVQVTLLKGEVWITLPSGKRSHLRAGHTIHLNAQQTSPLSSDALAKYEAQMVALHWSEKKSVPNRDSVVSNQAETVAASSASPTGNAHRITSSLITQTQLLKSIRKERQHHNWGKVAELYRRLIRLAPGSETSTVSRVSLADVYLSKLHRYQEALSLYNRYLQSGHTAVLPEATFGKCRTLKQMGKTEQEAKCLQRFIARYPTAFQTPDARVRLKTLKDI